MKKRSGEQRQRPPRLFVLDCEALSQAVRGDRRMIARLDLAARGEAEVVTSPMTLVEAYDGRTTETRWDWVLSRLTVVDIGKDEARRARRLLAEAELHGHKYAIDAVLAVVARQQKGHVTVFTSDVDDLERLVPDTIVVTKV
ncbi:PIN domain-containing protein [Streptomyces sp. NPDC058953]|uniref:PIN domain-containing protein n=1 Tax=unclassified Streptomyces TaxID=2593676 RepID=UPI0036B46128